MSNGIDYDKTIAALVKQYDARIERLRPCLTQEIPELRNRCTDEMSALILNREAVRRGLVQISDLEEPCPTCCPEEFTA
jgi:hypothetical protein